mgnify:CR=1 FL=1
MTIRIGTRRSKLALAQTAMVAAALKERFPGTEIQPVEIVTHGDRVLDKPLDKIGGKGVFVEEIEQTMRSGDIDIAVHSAKDLPVQLGEGLEISGVLPRGDYRDMLVMRKGAEFGSTDSFTVGTGSLRRRMNLAKLYPGAVFADIRGNVDTRLRKLSDGEFDAIVLAAAGVERLGIPMDGFTVRKFGFDEFLPAPCQAIIAAECAAGSAAAEMVSEVSDRETMLCFNAERGVIAALGADCTVPVGAYSEISGGVMRLTISDRNGNTAQGECPPEDSAALIKELISRL